MLSSDFVPPSVGLAETYHPTIANPTSPVILLVFSFSDSIFPPPIEKSVNFRNHTQLWKGP